MSGVRFFQQKTLTLRRGDRACLTNNRDNAQVSRKTETMAEFDLKAAREFSPYNGLPGRPITTSHHGTERQYLYVTIKKIRPARLSRIPVYKLTFQATDHDAPTTPV